MVSYMNELGQPMSDNEFVYITDEIKEAGSIPLINEGDSNYENYISTIKISLDKIRSKINQISFLERVKWVFVLSKMEKFKIARIGYQNERHFINILSSTYDVDKKVSLLRDFQLDILLD